MIKAGALCSGLGVCTRDLVGGVEQRDELCVDAGARCFRAWLKTVTQHALSDFVAWRRKDPGQTAAPIDMIAESAEASTDLEQRLEHAFDAEVLELAMHRVKKRVKVCTWDAFHLTAVEGLSGAAAAARLEIPVAHVFVAKNRVQKMLQEEAKALKKNLR